MSLGRNVEVEEERRHPVLRVLSILLVLVVVALGGTVLTGGIWLKHKMGSSLPQLDGRELTPGLTAPVMVRRDRHGVPHIQAANLDDLVFAQGYVTAQDRLWELDMERRVASGEAAEILGPKLVDHDRMQRVLAMRATAERLTASLSERDRRYFDDYARGVNAFIGSHGDRLPAEFRLLMYEPKPWQPVDSMLVVLSMVQTLDEHWPDKLNRELVTRRLGPTLAADLYPTGSWRDRPPVTTDPPLTAPQQNIPDVPLDESQTGKLDGDLLHLHGVAGRETACLGCNPGSNEWAVSGSRTASGQAMLSNDMHLEHQIPNIWYETDLEAPGFHAAGVTVPGIPFVVAGHNEHVAWGFTAMYGDTQDIYVEKVNAEGEYQGTDGGWHPIEHEQETIKVRWGNDVPVDVERTDHGVVLTPLLPHEQRVLALKWNVYDAKASGFPLLAIDTAANWTDFRSALSQWWAPTLNVVYADDQGHIGYQAVGFIPSRPGGLAGMPIADGQHEWQGFIGFDQLPSALDPPGGILATANARVTPDAYATPLTLEWAEPYRNERIWKWLEPKQKLTEQDMLTLQTDTYSEVDQEIAQRLAYGIDHASRVDARLRQAADLLRSWDGSVGANSAPAAITAMAKARFWPMALEPKVGADWRLYTWAENTYAGEQILMNEPAAWLPMQYASWDDFLADMVRQGLEQGHAPSDLATWRYGSLRPVDIEHPLYGMLPWFRDWTGTGMQPQSGDGTTVKQVGRSFGPSQRFTIDWSQVDAATENIVMGESGDPLSPYYRDQWPYWYGGKTFALPFTDAAVTAATAHTLRLEP
ncbi:MAG TPA: penicillin acylase family protein [Acidobacteriaceae bacterium]|jgi:penicillin amidase|nr:penicillin acylase family protein [Acidobacteriaceae bacterium]